MRKPRTRVHPVRAHGVVVGIGSVVVVAVVVVEGAGRGTTTVAQ
jgi:hypothetical protein